MTYSKGNLAKRKHYFSEYDGVLDDASVPPSKLSADVFVKMQEIAKEQGPLIVTMKAGNGSEIELISPTYAEILDAFIANKSIVFLTESAGDIFVSRPTGVHETTQGLYFEFVHHSGVGFREINKDGTVSGGNTRFTKDIDFKALKDKVLSASQQLGKLENLDENFQYYWTDIGTNEKRQPNDLITALNNFHSFVICDVSNGLAVAFLEYIGDTSSLKTEDKTDVVKAINEVKDDVDSKADQSALDALVKDDELLTYYGTTNIQPSGSELFTFTELEDGTYAVAAKDKKTISGDVVIPYEHNGKHITAITVNGFRECTHMTSVIIPNSITEIGSQAFHSCQFTKLKIPESVKTIKSFTFFSCNKMTELIISEGVEVLEENAFHSSTGVTYLELPQSLTKVGEGAFAGMSKTKDIYYGGTKQQFDKLNVGADLLWQATVYCKYTNETAFANSRADIDKQGNNINTNTNNISTLSKDLSELKSAFLKGMQIKEFILYPGDSFVLKPNTIFVTFPANNNKTMEVYKADGTRVVSGAGIIGAVCSEIKYDADVAKYQFRACTLYQQNGLLGTDYEASYFYFEEGAYIKYTGTSDYARVLCNVPVAIDN